MARHYIKEWRKHRKLTQQQVAGRMEKEPGVPLMTHATFSNIETGKQSPTLEQLYAIASALGVTVSALVENNPNMDGDVVDLLARIDENNRPTVLAMLKAAIGE